MIYLYAGIALVFYVLIKLIYREVIYRGIKIGFKEAEKRSKLRADLGRIEGYDQALKVFLTGYEHWKKEMIETKSWAEFKEREEEEKRRIEEIKRILLQGINERRHALEGGLGTLNRRAFGRLQGTLLGGFDTKEQSADISDLMDCLMAQMRGDPQMANKKHEEEKKKNEPS